MNEKPYTVWPFYAISALMIVSIIIDCAWTGPSYTLWMPGFALGFSVSSIIHWTRQNRLETERRIRDAIMANRALRSSRGLPSSCDHYPPMKHPPRL